MSAVFLGVRESTRPANQKTCEHMTQSSKLRHYNCLVLPSFTHFFNTSASQKTIENVFPTSTSKKKVVGMDSKGSVPTFFSDVVPKCWKGFTSSPA